LFAEAIVEELERLADGFEGPLNAPALPYWKDFVPGTVWHCASRAVSRLLAPSLLTPEVRSHLFWLLERAAKEHPRRWVFVRDLLADVYGWWAEGVHLRPQPVRERGQIVWSDPYVVELAKWVLPFTDADAEPRRTTTIDGNLGYGLMQLTAWIHSLLRDVSDPGAPVRPYQRLSAGKTVCFCPGNGYFRQILARCATVIMPFAPQYALPDVWLEGEDLSGENFNEADLTRANLARCNLAAAVLFYARLTQATLSGADLSSANLFSANLTGAELRKVDLGHARLLFANLSGANLWASNLSGADLSNADLSRADLNSVNLERAILFGCKLLGTLLAAANLTGANLKETTLLQADFSGATLDEVDLSQASITESDFLEASLKGARLSSATIRKTGFRRARLQGADLSSATIVECDFSQADLNGANLVSAKLCGTNLTGASLEGARLGDTDFDWAEKSDGVEQAPVGE
jgi:uncharacterized protein YjbI with pentapeptide repeats